MSSARRASVVGMTGGLGNQLFQYAFGEALAHHTGSPTLYDVSAYRTRPDYFTIEALGLEVPPRRGLSRLPHAQGRVAAAGIAARRLMGPRRVILDDSRAPAADAPPAWYYGYWQHLPPGWLVPGIAHVRAQVKVAEGEPYRAVHVRRGDMVAQGRATGADRVAAVLEALGEPAEAPVRVYTDDPAWCTEHLAHLPVRVMAGGTVVDDFLGLATAERLGLSFSTFSWWAAMVRARAAGAVVAPRELVEDLGTADQQWTVI